jgi:hypothetical protein
MPDSKSTRKCATRLAPDLVMWLETEAVERDRTLSWVIARCCELTRRHSHQLAPRDLG